MLAAAPAIGPNGNWASIRAPARKTGIGTPGTLERDEVDAPQHRAEQAGRQAGREPAHHAGHRLEQRQGRLAPLLDDQGTDPAHPLDRVVDVERHREPGRGELVAGDVGVGVGADVDRHRHPEVGTAEPFRRW